MKLNKLAIPRKHFHMFPATCIYIDLHLLVYSLQAHVHVRSGCSHISMYIVQVLVHLLV